jgi:uncharacterized protein DUF4430
VRRTAARLAVLALAALGGCGIGPGKERGEGAELRVTRDFGTHLLRSGTERRVREGETVMRFLQSKAKVTTRYGGGFVQSIDGLAGGGPGGRRDWFYFVNGIEAGVGAADRELAAGDVVQWDYRRWQGAMRVPAIVGAYPEPFVHGSEGKRLPARVECEQPGSAPCREVKQRLKEVGVFASGAELGSAGGEDLLRVVVGRWRSVRQVKALRALESGPEASGIFARFSGGGARLDLLDALGTPAQTATRGTGLVAATKRRGGGVTWLVTGLDTPGVTAAAGALGRRTLRDAFAVAVTPRGPLRLPLPGGGQ